MFIDVSIRHPHKTKHAIRSHLLDGITYSCIVVSFAGNALVVYTKQHMRIFLRMTIVITGRLCLICNQRRFGSEDTHIINDEVVSIKVRCHIIYTHAEVRIVASVFVVQNREIDLIPLIRRLYITCHIGGNIIPCDTIQRTLYGEDEVRTGFLGILVTGVSHIAGEEHLLSGTQVALQRQSGYLTGRCHTVAINHISVSGSTVLLHLMPIGTIRDTVNQTVLTVVREVGLFMITIMRQSRCLRISITVRRIGPWQRMRINMVVTTRLDIVEIQTLQYFITILDVLIGNQRFGSIFSRGLYLRSVLIRTMIDDLITTYIEPIVTVNGYIFGRRTSCFFTPRTQTIIYGINRTSSLGRNFQEILFFRNRMGTKRILLGLWIIGIPKAVGIPAATPDHRVLTTPTGCIFGRTHITPVIIVHVVTQQGLRVIILFQVFVTIPLLCLQ